MDHSRNTLFDSIFGSIFAWPAPWEQFAMQSPQGVGPYGPALGNIPQGLLSPPSRTISVPIRSGLWLEIRPDAGMAGLTALDGPRLREVVEGLLKGMDP